MGEADSSCSMVGLLGILIQVGLGVLSFSVLIIKRIRQKPQRPWKIWLFDTSKQLISQAIAHFINLTISIALAYNDTSSDECLWYFMTNILDNSLGVLICVLTLKAVERNLRYRRKTEYLSGNYYTEQKMTVQIEIMDLGKGVIRETIEVKEEEGEDVRQEEIKRDELVEERRERMGDDSRVKGEMNNTQTIVKYQINYKAWLVQLLIWISIVVLGKSILFGFQIGLANPLKQFSFLTMGWIEAYPVLQLLVVIVIVPVALNGIAFWVQDNFLKKKEQDIPEGASPLIEETSPRKNGLIQMA